MSIQRRILPVTDDAIARASEHTGSVMIARECRFRRGRSHLRPIKRGGTWGVRLGRRGGAFYPITAVRAVHVDGELVYFEVTI